MIIALTVEQGEGCLRDPSLVDSSSPGPSKAQVILRYHDGRTEVIRGLLEVRRRMDAAVDEVVAAEQRRGVAACWW